LSEEEGKRKESLAAIAREISAEIGASTILGLGSGSTVASILRELATALESRRLVKKVRAVATSMQIQMVADEVGLQTVPLRKQADLVVDGADQVDDRLDMIKGGGGALLKEKILMANSRRRIVVADEAKFVTKLCLNSARVPVEVVPFARETVKERLVGLGGVPHERLLAKGFPYFTESGNVILDTEFPPIDRAAEMEAAIKMIPGVVENGIFTIKPIRVYKIGKDGASFSVRTSD